MSTTRLVRAGLILSLLVAGVLSLAASAHPDGLEFVAESLGFGEEAQDSATAGSPLADYAVRGLDGAASGGLAGVIGVLVVAALAFGLFALLRRRPARP